jgi:hypothetical protein
MGTEAADFAARWVVLLQACGVPGNTG